VGLFSKLSLISRTRKLELLNKTFHPTDQLLILDVGAEVNPRGDRTLQLIDSYPWKNNITAVNLDPQHIDLIKQHYPEINAIVADGCELPWPDKYFDIVYSNAVIEHLGDFERQKKMAEEIMRVGKQWFVTTPNRWYPFEFHMRLPFVTWIPGDVYLRIGNIISYNHVRKKYMFGINHDGLRLMSAREMKNCFPDSKIISQRITFMAETLIAIGGDSING
jgi:SAM-dependent methyltransferase